MWVSYRDAYRAMVVFEKYGGPKNLIQSEMQVAPRDRDGGGEALQLTLTGKSTQLNLPLDPTGRTSLPLLKAAYDENAVLVLSGKDREFVVRSRVSIMVRRDGVYDVAELRQACEQALGYARYVDRSFGGRQCVGVRFVFPKKADANVRVRKAQGDEIALPVGEGVAFQGDADAAFPIVSYRFTAERVQLVTSRAPLAIVPLFE
ncbi:hypothetical protein E4O92_24325 [Massilia horti]|uniref:Uncharacterized protein n=2 Tax=Massilia horti TaxID=2562153 RepID=A0A4Y9SKY8_9BURK|nr:hypothetical protein E4O92_24325 [Massilia horti]